MAVAAGALGCSADREPIHVSPAPPTHQDLDFPLAEIAGTAVPANPLHERLARWQEARAATKRPPTSSELEEKRLVLARWLVNEELILRAAAERGILGDGLTDAQLLDGFEERMKGPAAVERYFQATGETREELARRLRSEELLDQLARDPPIVVGDDAVEQWYREHLAEYDRPEQVRLQRFLLPVPSEAARARIRARADQAAAAQDLAAWVAEHRKVFGGGDAVTRWWARQELSSEVASWAFGKTPGSPRRVIPTKEGFEVVQFLDRRPVLRQSLAQVFATIRDKLAQRERQIRRQRILADLRSRWAVKEPLFEAALRDRRERLTRARDPDLHGGAFGGTRLR